MPPLEVSASEVQQAVKTFKAIENRVDARMNSNVKPEGRESAVARVAAIFGIKVNPSEEKSKS